MTPLQRPPAPLRDLAAGSPQQANVAGRDSIGAASAPGPVAGGSENGPAEARIARGALALLSTQPLTWAASLITAILLPHFLGARALGEYTTALTIASLVGILASLGVPTYLVRSVATLPARAAANVGASIVLTSGLTALAATILSVLSPSLGLPLSREVLLIILGGAAIGSAQGVLFSQLIGQERHALFAWLNAGGALLGAATGICALAAGTGLIGLVGSGTFTALALFTLTLRLSGTRLRRDSFAPRLWAELARGGIPFMGWNLALRIYGEADKLLLALLVPTAVVGWYGAAYRIIAIPVFVPTLITTPLLPALSRQAEDRACFAGTIRRAVVCVLLLTVPISAMIVSAAPAVPGMLHWPQEFRGSVPLMMILALHQPFVAVDMVLATGLLALRQERRWLCVGVAASIFNLALNPLLIPLFQSRLANGAIAAAIVTLLTELLTCAGALALLPRDILSRETATTSLKILFAGVCLWLTATALRATPLPFAVAAGGLAFVFVAAALRVVRPEDIAFLHGIVLQAFRRRTGRPAA
jgi:O-antigen/teichoic acid export membrane protein